MDNINISDNQFQANFNDEIRRRCRLAVERFGGLRKFAQAINEDEGKWFNRLTDGRVVGFDVEWLNKILLITGSFEPIIPFFKVGQRVRIDPIRKLCNILNYAVLPMFRVKAPEEGSTEVLISSLLHATQKLIRKSR